MPIDLTTLTAREAITAVYIGYYDRAPDPTGLNFWVDVLNDGFDLNNDGDSLDDIASNFAGQEETLTVHTFFTNPTDASASAFVTELYSNLFNRAPDDAGLAFWTAALQEAIAGNGDLTVGEIILEIIKGAQGDDIDIIMNKIEVGLDWNDSADAAGIVYAGNDAAIASATSILDNVDGTDASVVAAKAATDTFVSTNEPGEPSVPGDIFILTDDSVRDNVTGTEGDDTFEAYNSDQSWELSDGDRMDGGAGSDTLTLHNSAQFVPAIAAITKSVETVVVTNQTNDRDSDADNNVGGYGFDDTVEVDVELDAGRMNGVTRWEDYDSRADLVIEDARDQDDTDGTFTGDITVAMVSTDPGNVDYAVYFDQPVNVSQNFGTLEIRVLDQEAATGLPAPSASSEGYLTESSLISFKFTYDDTEIEVTLADELGVTYGPEVSFSDLLTQVQNSTAAALVAAGITDLNFSASLGAPVQIGVGNQFTLPIVLTFDVTADEISANSDNIVVQGRDQNNDNATDVAGSLSTDRTTTEELIRLNVELDDVGKGSMGGDAMFGAMSTGRQDGDDGTSDSIGIQQFDIEVDRSSQLQTINSTNNSLEVVNITNGENDGPNNTTTAVDEMIGDLVVRGQANNDNSDIDTDGPMPGAVPQHNSYGFSDVRVINAAAMVGAVDITAELTEETVEKYLDIQDSQSDGEVDDVDFQYSLGNNNDEFLLNMDASSLQSAGTGSREDFDLTISGGAGNDVITTNIGNSNKRIDEQGQDHYELNSNGPGTTSWYTNAVSNVAADLVINGGTGNDTIWTHGTGDFTISDGTGMDVVYTDNSRAVEGRNSIAPVIERNLIEHDQIDYVAGAIWAFNAEGPFGTGLTGATNETITIATGAVLTTATSGFATITVSYFGATGAAAVAGSANAGTAYTVTATIPFSELSVSGTGVVTIDEQALNQAIKAGINGDAILSNLLEAADGPGNSLVVVAKTDGEHVAADLDVEVTGVTVNATAATVTPLSTSNPTAYDTTDGAFIFDDLTGFGAGDSFAESDNVINVAGDSANDLFVLSTSDAAGAQITVNTALDALSDLNFASNETLVFSANFGTDTILNFDGALTGTGVATGTTVATRVDGEEDVLDFSPVTGVGTNSYVSAGLTNELTSADADGTIDLIDLSAVAVDGVDANSTIDAVEVAALLGGGDLVASDHIVIIRDSTGIDSTVSSVNNAGQVWHIVDGAGASDVTATQIGTINLVGTDWLSLTLDNFA